MRMFKSNKYFRNELIDGLVFSSTQVIKLVLNKSESVNRQLERMNRKLELMCRQRERTIRQIVLVKWQLKLVC